MFGVNPGTVLYHMRRLEVTSLVVLQDAKRKRGIVEKRYRSVARSVLLQPPAAEATEERLAPLVAAIAADVLTIDASQAVRGQAALVGNVAEARIGMVHQREITKRLAELALWIESLAEDEKGTPMRLVAIFGPTATPAKPARRRSKP